VFAGGDASGAGSNLRYSISFDSPSPLAITFGGANTFGGRLIFFRSLKAFAWLVVKSGKQTRFVIAFGSTKGGEATPCRGLERSPTDEVLDTSEFIAK
jgi:hypothetical protein